MEFDKYINLKLKKNDPLLKRIKEIKEETGIKTDTGAIRAGLMLMNGKRGDNEK
jgi:hypothetical protein